MEDAGYTAARRLNELDMRDIIDRVFNKGSLIGVVLKVQEDEGNAEPGIMAPSEDECVTPCTFDVYLTRKPSTEELRALGSALGFSSAQVLEPYQDVAGRIRYAGSVSFVTVTRHGGAYWLDGKPVNTPEPLDYVAAHFEHLAKIARQRAEKAKTKGTR